MLLFYVRHGDPIYNPDSLTPKGEEQAAALVDRMTRFGLDEIYVSPSKRALQTAEPTCQKLGMTPTVLEWCKEHYAYRDFSVRDKDGHTHWVFQDDDYCRLMVSPEIRKLDREWYRHEAFSVNNFEKGYERIQQETYNFMEQLGYRHRAEDFCYDPINPNERRIALFAHQGFGLAFLSCLLDVPYPMMCTHFDMGHTGVTAIEFKEAQGIVIPKVLQLSNDSHLYHAGLSTDYQNRILI